LTRQPLYGSARRTSRWVAQHDGFNLHAGVTVAQGHRVFLERLCRYCARPAFALDRLRASPTDALPTG
jgi:hypothetical protein